MPPTDLFRYVGVCSGICFLLSDAMLYVVFTYEELNHWGFHHCNPLELTHGRHMCNLVQPPATQSAGLQPFQLYCGAYSVGSLAESHPIPPSSLHGGEGSSFPGLFPLNDTVNFESAVGIKPGDSGVVIGYQVDEFTHIWSAEWFVAHSHIYPGFTGKVS